MQLVRLQCSEMVDEDWPAPYSAYSNPVIGLDRRSRHSEDQPCWGRLNRVCDAALRVGLLVKTLSLKLPREDAELIQFLF